MSDPSNPLPPSQPTPSGATPAGWYADPQNPSQRRWFDGTNWTAQTQSAGPVPMAPSPLPAGPAKNGLGTAALVLGILALVGSWIPVLNIFALILGVVAVILGLVGLRKQPKTLALVGTILGGLAIIVSIIVLVFFGKAVQDLATTQKTVVWTATVSNGQASSTWGVAASGTSNDTFTGTWTKTTTATGSDLAATLIVQGDMTAPNQQVTCEIKVDGKVVASQSGQSTVTCTGALIG